MTIYEYKDENGNVKDCLENYRWKFENGERVPTEPTKGEKEEAARLARKYQRTAWLIYALKAIRNSDDQEQIDARKIVNQYLNN